MAISESEWLISSDVAQEVAFRIDLPEPERGRWVLSYLPTSMRLSREQAIAGLVLAEMILLGLIRARDEFDAEMAALHANVLGLTVTDVMCLLALREHGRNADEGDAGERRRRPVMTKSNEVETGVEVSAISAQLGAHKVDTRLAG